MTRHVKLLKDDVIGRRFILMDNNPETLVVMAQRFDGVEGIEWLGFDPAPYQHRQQQRSLFSTQSGSTSLTR